MSNDVTFEELEKTAFEFAKAMGAGTGADLSYNAMLMAERWHAERRLRESLYDAKRVEWKEIPERGNYSLDNFIIDQDYWVIALNESTPKIAKFSKASHYVSANGPRFYDDGMDIDSFDISHYIPKEEGDKILAKTPPRLPAGLKKKDEDVRNIPSVKIHW